MLLAQHHLLLRVAWSAHGGVEVKTDGDAFFVAFARAQDAVEAAMDAQQRLQAHAWPAGARVRVRMGLHSGEPHLDVGDLGVEEALARGRRMPWDAAIGLALRASTVAPGAPARPSP